MAHSAEQPSAMPTMNAHHPAHPTKKPSLLHQIGEGIGERVADKAMDSQLSDEEKQQLEGHSFKDKVHKFAEIEKEKGMDKGMDYISDNLNPPQDLQNFWSTYCGCFGSGSSNQNQNQNQN